jgi:lysophospholipase L1-like esterase
MPTIKITFPTPTDNVTSSSNLDILLYNGLSGSQNLFATILKNDVRKSIVGANIEITGIVVDASTTYNFSAKARDEAGNLSANFSPVTVHIVPSDFNIDAFVDLINLQTNNVTNDYTIVAPNKISSWNDRNALGNWTQATDTLRPLNSNGVLFDGIDDGLVRSVNLDVPNYSFYAVIQHLGTAANQCLIGSTNSNDWINFTTNNNIGVSTGGSQKRRAIAGIKGLRPVILGIRKNGNTLTYTVNDRTCLEVIPIVSGETLPSTLFGRIGSLLSSSRANVNVKAVMLKSTAVADVDHKKVVDGLYERYNLASTITADNVCGFGDSNTFGISVVPYLTGLATAMGLGQLNLGISGSFFVDTNPSPNNGFTRFQSQIVTRPYRDYIVIQYGTNDILSGGANDALFYTQMNSMVGSLISQGYLPARICICSNPYLGDNNQATALNDFRTRILQVVANHNIKYFDLLEDMRSNGGNALLNADKVHLNQAGQDRQQAGVFAAFNS